MVRRRRSAKSGSSSPSRPRGPLRRSTSMEASVPTLGCSPSRTTALWIVVVRAAFRSEFGPNDPAPFPAPARDRLGDLLADFLHLRGNRHFPAVFVYLRGAPSRPPLSLGWTSKRRAVAFRRTVHGADGVLLCPPARTN